MCIEYAILTKYLTRIKPKNTHHNIYAQHISTQYICTLPDTTLYTIHPFAPNIGRPTNVHVDTLDNDSKTIRTPHSDPTAHNRSLLEGTHRYGIRPKGRVCPSASTVESLFARSSTTNFFPIRMHSSSRLECGKSSHWMSGGIPPLQRNECYLKCSRIRQNSAEFGNSRNVCPIAPFNIEEQWFDKMHLHTKTLSPHLCAF